MSQLQDILDQARSFLTQQQPEVALKTLEPHINTYQDDVLFLQLYGETLLENSDLESAYEILMKSCELDQDGSKGAEKFLYLGQIIGGEDGLNFLNVGLNKLQDDMSNTTTEKKSVVQKLNQGIFAEIEIWMTDLCMEPQAEAKCDELIQLSLQLDESNAETWSLLASIRISQQLPHEAITAVQKSWELFNTRKQELENAANTNTQDTETETDANGEYVELIQPLLTLCKYAIELELFDLGIEIATNVQDINENCLESYYLEGFSNYLVIKKLQNQVGADQNVGEIYTTLPEIKLDDETIREPLLNARMALTNGIKLAPYAQEEEDEEFVAQMRVLVKECGGMLKKKEMAELERATGGDDEAHWEDEIDSE